MNAPVVSLAIAEDHGLLDRFITDALLDTCLDALMDALTEKLERQHCRPTKSPSELLCAADLESFIFDHNDLSDDCKRMLHEVVCPTSYATDADSTSLFLAQQLLAMSNIQGRFQAYLQRLSPKDAERMRKAHRRWFKCATYAYRVHMYGSIKWQPTCRASLHNSGVADDVGPATPWYGHLPEHKLKYVEIQDAYYFRMFMAWEMLFPDETCGAPDPVDFGPRLAELEDLCNGTCDALVEGWGNVNEIIIDQQAFYNVTRMFFTVASNALEQRRLWTPQRIVAEFVELPLFSRRTLDRLSTPLPTEVECKLSTRLRKSSEKMRILSFVVLPRHATRRDDGPSLKDRIVDTSFANCSATERALGFEKACFMPRIESLKDTRESWGLGGLEDEQMKPSLDGWKAFCIATRSSRMYTCKPVHGTIKKVVGGSHLPWTTRYIEGIVKITQYVTCLFTKDLRSMGLFDFDISFDVLSDVGNDSLDDIDGTFKSDLKAHSQEVLLSIRTSGLIQELCRVLTELTASHSANNFFVEWQEQREPLYRMATAVFGLLVVLTNEFANTDASKSSHYLRQVGVLGQACEAMQWFPSSIFLNTLVMRLLFNLCHNDADYAFMWSRCGSTVEALIRPHAYVMRRLKADGVEHTEIPVSATLARLLQHNARKVSALPRAKDGHASFIGASRALFQRELCKQLDLHQGKSRSSCYFDLLVMLVGYGPGIRKPSPVIDSLEDACIPQPEEIESSHDDISLPEPLCDSLPSCTVKRPITWKKEDCSAMALCNALSYNAFPIQHLKAALLQVERKHRTEPWVNRALCDDMVATFGLVSIAVRALNVQAGRRLVYGRSYRAADSHTWLYCQPTAQDSVGAATQSKRHRHLQSAECLPLDSGSMTQLTNSLCVASLSFRMMDGVHKALATWRVFRSICRAETQAVQNLNRRNRVKDKQVHVRLTDALKRHTARMREQEEATRQRIERREAAVANTIRACATRAIQAVLQEAREHERARLASIRSLNAQAALKRESDKERRDRIEWQRQEAAKEKAWRCERKEAILKEQEAERLKKQRKKEILAFQREKEARKIKAAEDALAIERRRAFKSSATEPVRPTFRASSIASSVATTTVELPRMNYHAKMRAIGRNVDPESREAKHVYKHANRETLSNGTVKITGGDLKIWRRGEATKIIASVARKSVPNDEVSSSTSSETLTVAQMERNVEHSMVQEAMRRSVCEQ